MSTAAAVVSTTSTTPNWHAVSKTDPSVSQARTVFASRSVWRRCRSASGSVFVGSGPQRVDREDDDLGD
jgi:hypothetical protein